MMTPSQSNRDEKEVVISDCLQNCPTDEQGFFLDHCWKANNDPPICES